MIMTGDGNNNDDGNDDDVKMIIIKTRGVNIKSENRYFDDNDASKRYDNYRDRYDMIMIIRIKLKKE